MVVDDGFSDDWSAMREGPTNAQAGGMQPKPDKRRSEFYFAAWRRAFDFEGVASRTEYWSFMLINAAVYLLLYAILFLGWLSDSTASLALILYWGVLLLPTLSVLIRRVRDATGSGWFTLVGAAALGATLFPARGQQRLDQLGSAYRDVWRKSADYLGVSNACELWTFGLINLAVLFVGAVIAYIISAAATEAPRNVELAIFILVGGCYWLSLQHGLSRVIP